MDNNYNFTSNNLPSEVSIWTKFKNFLCQDIEVTLSPRQEKVFGAIHDFWTQEITGEKVKGFLFKEIEIIDNIEL